MKAIFTHAHTNIKHAFFIKQGALSMQLTCIEALDLAKNINAKLEYTYKKEENKVYNDFLEKARKSKIRSKNR